MTGRHWGKTCIVLIEQLNRVRLRMAIKADHRTDEDVGFRRQAVLHEAITRVSAHHM
jgi:hypothetical protein